VTEHSSQLAEHLLYDVHNIERDLQNAERERPVNHSQCARLARHLILAVDRARTHHAPTSWQAEQLRDIRHLAVLALHQHYRHLRDGQGAP
jgi:hypothetical protein